jgi:hypothetical protein
MKRLMAVTLGLGLALATACEKDRAETSTTTKTETKTETKTASGDRTTETKTTETKTTETKNPVTDIGVAECDDYVKKMTDCSTKVSPAAAGPMKESIETMKKAAKDAAATPESKTALARGCKQALDAAKSAYASMGCSF